MTRTTEENGSRQGYPLSLDKLAAAILTTLFGIIVLQYFNLSSTMAGITTSIGDLNAKQQVISTSFRDMNEHGTMVSRKTNESVAEMRERLRVLEEEHKEPQFSKAEAKEMEARLTTRIDTLREELSKQYKRVN